MVRTDVRRGVALPVAFTPQLARLVRQPPTGDTWLHELKYDGYRLACRIENGTVHLISRTGNDWTARFPEVRDAALRLGVERALLDGELAVVLADGRTSFQALQNVVSGGARGRLVYFAFDLLHLDGDDVARRPLEQRKEILAALLDAAPARDGTMVPAGGDTMTLARGSTMVAAGGGVVASARGGTTPPARKRRGSDAARVFRYSEHVVGDGPAFYAEVCRRGLEGVVSKRRDLPYTPGRQGGWLKTKCLQREVFVIGGFTDPAGTRPGIGALIVGTHDDAGRLRCAGKVGTGFTQASASALRRRLEALEIATSPFTPFPPGFRRRGVHWVRPVLGAEVAFSERTSDGNIRQPSFQGLREIDSDGGVAQRRASAPARATDPSRGAPAPTIAHNAVIITHPERVLYPDVGLTKGDVARYYEEVGAWIVPHLAGRPLTLMRCPRGIDDACSFMKHSRVWAPAGLRRVRIRENTKLGEYLVADDRTGVLALVQMDVLELHTWNSTVDDAEHPNRLVLDLDPGPAVRWPAVVAGARLVRDVLAALSVQSFVKTTGGVGLHVVVPLVPELDWRACLDVARAIAAAIARHDPRTYTTALPKAGREDKILIDYLRNNRTNTSVAAYSTRARAGAPVSLPLMWDEVTTRLRPERFTVRTVPARLRNVRDDPWAAYWRLRQRLPRNAADALAAL